MKVTYDVTYPSRFAHLHHSLNIETSQLIIFDPNSKFPGNEGTNDGLHESSIAQIETLTGETKWINQIKETRRDQARCRAPAFMQRY